MGLYGQGLVELLRAQHASARQLLDMTPPRPKLDAPSMCRTPSSPQLQTASPTATPRSPTCWRDTLQCTTCPDDSILQSEAFYSPPVVPDVRLLGTSPASELALSHRAASG